MAGFEAALDADLTGVRFRADATAAAYAAQLDAEAVTVGRDVLFAAGRLDPYSATGRELLAHELIHVADHAHLGRLHRQPAATAAAAARGTAGGGRRQSGPGGMTDPVVLVEVSTFGTDATLSTQSGARIAGHVTGLNLEPGVYDLVPNYQARLWAIRGSRSGLHFTLTVDDPDVAPATGDATAAPAAPQPAAAPSASTAAPTDSAAPAPAAKVPQIDPFSLTYAHTLMRVAEGHPPQSDANFDLDAVIFNIEHLVGGPGWMSGASEEDVIALIESVPVSRSAEFMRRLAQPRGDGESLLSAMDDAIHFGNNLRLHEVLSLQRLRAAPEKSVAAVANAPVLPWHDVMGFFEDDATFTAEEAGPGKTRVQYLGGDRVHNSKDFREEVRKLPFDLFYGGMIYDDNQPLIVHDYDAGRFVLVTAGELAGYKHLGVRNFLGHAATVATFAIPISAAETVAEKIAVVTLERVLPTVFLLVDENRLNLVKWFPKWGPKMIQYSDTLKALTAAVGFARIAVSGFKIFQNWRDISRARAALEGAVRLDAQAERVAATLEKEAEAAFQQAEKARDAEAAAAGAKGGPGTPTEGATPPPEPQPPATGAAPPSGTPPAVGQAPHPAPAPHPVPEPNPPSGAQPGAEPHPGSAHTGTEPSIPAGTAGRAWEGINDDTRLQLKADQGLREGLEQNPLAAEAVKLCASRCYPNLTKAQCERLEQVLERAQQTDVPVNIRRLREAFKATQSAAERDGLIASIEDGVNQRAHYQGAPHTLGEATGESEAARRATLGKQTEQLERNKVSGTSGEARVEEEIHSRKPIAGLRSLTNPAVDSPATLLGSQVKVQTSAGVRIIDHLVRLPDGEIVALEVKSGGAVRDLEQLEKDYALEHEGGTILGRDAPGVPRRLGTAGSPNTPPRGIRTVVIQRLVPTPPPGGSAP
jgi:hypothetical protein